VEVKKVCLRSTDSKKYMKIAHSYTPGHVETGEDNQYGVNINSGDRNWTVWIPVAFPWGAVGKAWISEKRKAYIHILR
jgi:hypothetical protein